MPNSAESIQLIDKLSWEPIYKSSGSWKQMDNEIQYIHFPQFDCTNDG